MRIGESFMLEVGMTLITNLFGELDVPLKDGFAESFELSLENRKMETFLFIHEQTLNGDNADDIIYFLNQIPMLYSKAKQAILARKDSSDQIRYYIDEQIETIETLYKVFNVDSNDEITDEMIIKQLVLSGIGISLNQDGRLDWNIDFTIAPEYTDELLVVYFDDKLVVSLIES